MDVKVINITKNKVLKPSKYSLFEKEQYLEQYLETGLGLKIIKANFNLTEQISEPIDFLCIDESYRLVLVEKRYGKDSRTIKSGLMYIDYIKDNLSKIKILIGDVLGKNIIKDICFDCRLVILTESFTNYDFSSIKNLPYTVEAINYLFLDKNLIFIKEYQNKKRDFIYYNGIRNSLYIDLENFLLSLGEDVSIFGFQNVIYVRKIKIFLYIIINVDEILLYINKKEYTIKNNNDLQKIYSKLEQQYDEN